jgi:hypothetical protein
MGEKVPDTFLDQNAVRTEAEVVQLYCFGGGRELAEIATLPR